MKIKQVIIMRKFPSLRTGKYIAQGAHASQIALMEAQMTHKEYYNRYLEDNITKVVVYVESKEELRDLHIEAGKAGLPRSFIIDSGFTEFKGEKTVTAVAIGPAPEELIDPITKHLPLF
jgi:PTH2 family peptidyl-tRNA hydrolase